MLPREVFLSHSDENRAFVAEVADVLVEHGIPVWYSRKALLGAQRWHDEIGAALERCDWFVVVLTPSAVESMWVKRELHFALRQERFDGRILSLLREPCDFERLSWTLPDFQRIDFTSRDQDNAWRDLLQSWGVGYRSIGPPS